jgi:Fe-S cluster biogenesis protein NfuA
MNDDSALMHGGLDSAEVVSTDDTRALTGGITAMEVESEPVAKPLLVHPLLERVERALDSIRPYLRSDGGNVRVVEIDAEYVVHVELLGACGHCPMSPMTLKAGVEEAIKGAVPEIVRVVAQDKRDEVATLTGNLEGYV